MADESRRDGNRPATSGDSKQDPAIEQQGETEPASENVTNREDILLDEALNDRFEATDN